MIEKKCTGIVHVKEHMREGHKVEAYDRKCGRHNYHDYYNDPYSQYINDEIGEREKGSCNRKRGGNMLSEMLTALLQLFWAIKDGDTMGYLQAISAIMNSPLFQVFTNWISQFGITSDMPNFKEQAAEFLASDEGQAELAAALQAHEYAHLSNIDLPYDAKNLNIKEPLSAKYANLDDVVQIKGILSVLGYYHPSQNTGMSPYFDNELTTAIKEFQKDYGFPITGSIHPNGIEMEMLNGMFENPMLASSQAYINGGGHHNYMSEAERTKAIVEGRKLRFRINGNPFAIVAAPHEIPELGVWNVKNNEILTDAFSKKHGVDPDMVKAIMYMEGANGHHFGINYLKDDIGKNQNLLIYKVLGKVISPSRSIMPMNMQNQWGRGFLGENYNPYNKAQNIEAGVKLIKRISESIENPTPAKIGSLWNGMMLDEVNDVGARVGKYYKEKPWKYPMKQWDWDKTKRDFNDWGTRIVKRELIKQVTNNELEQKLLEFYLPNKTPDFISELF